MSIYFRLLATVTLVASLYACSPVVITPTSTNPQVHLALGNPSNATSSVANSTNYLLVKPQYAMSYNNSFRHANWVAWELSAKWIGAEDRSDDFRPDTELPSNFYQVQPSDYTASGFDRGHLCPSADRTRTKLDNSATFLMSNMIPQSPQLNRNAWANLESYCRRLSDAGYLLYIVAGTYGTGGDGSNGAKTVIKNNINVPQRVYKVVVATQKYSLADADSKTIVIAADFPNSDAVVTSRDWVRFLTTPAAIEQNAGVTLLQGLPASIRSSMKDKLFDYANATPKVETLCKMFNNRPLYVGSEGGCYYYNASGTKTYVDKSVCNCL